MSFKKEKKIAGCHPGKYPSANETFTLFTLQMWNLEFFQLQLKKNDADEGFDAQARRIKANMPPSSTSKDIRWKGREKKKEKIENRPEDIGTKQTPIKVPLMSENMQKKPKNLVSIGHFLHHLALIQPHSLIHSLPHSLTAYIPDYMRPLSAVSFNRFFGL